jgi:hypothetical protein
MSDSQSSRLFGEFANVVAGAAGWPPWLPRLWSSTNYSFVGIEDLTDEEIEIFRTPVVARTSSNGSRTRREDAADQAA